MNETDLQAYVQSVNAGEDDFIAQCWATAGALITKYIGDAEVPEFVLDQARLEVGSELYHRRNAPSGVQQFADPLNGSSVRLAKDPMTGAYTLLQPYVGLGFA